MRSNQYDDYDDPYVEDIQFDNLDDLYDDEISNDLVVQDEEFEYLNIKRNNRRRLLIWLGITFAVIALLIIAAGTTLGIIKNKANKPSDNKDSFKYLEVSDPNHAKLSDTTFEYIPDEHEVLNGSDLARLLRVRSDKKADVDKLSTYLYENINGNEYYVRRQRISKEDLLDTNREYRLKVVYRLKEKDNKTNKETYRYYKFDFKLKLNYKNVIFFYTGNNTYLDGVNRKKYQDFVTKGEDNRKKGNAEGSYYEFLYQKGIDPYLDSDKLIPKDEFKTAYKSIDRLSSDTYSFSEISRASNVYLPDITSKNRNVLLKFQIRTITNDGRLGAVLKTIEKWVTDGEKDSITTEIIQRLQNEFTLPTSEYSINGKKFDSDGKPITRDGLYEINPSIWYSKIESGKDLDNPSGHQVDLYDISLSNFAQNNIGVEKKIKKAEGTDFTYREVVLEQYVKQIYAYMSYEIPNASEQPAPTRVQTGDLVGVPFDPEDEKNNKNYELIPRDKYLDYWTVKENGSKIYKDTSLNIGSPYKIEKDITLRAELENYKVIRLALPSSKYPFDSTVNPDWEINQVIRLRKDQPVYNNIINHFQQKIRNLEQFTEAENPLNEEDFGKLIATNVDRTNYFTDDRVKAGDPSVRDEYYLRFPKVGVLLKETVDGTTLSEPRHYLVLANQQTGLETSLIKRPNTFITPQSIAELRNKVIPYSGAITLDVKYESYRVSIVFVQKHDQTGSENIIASNITGIKLGQKLEKDTIKQIINKAKTLAPINNWSQFAELNYDSSLQDSTKLLEDTDFTPDEQHDKNFNSNDRTYKIYVKYSAGYGKVTVEPEYTKKEDNRTFVKDASLKKEIDVKFSEKGNLSWDDIKENPLLKEVLREGFILDPVNINDLKGKFDNANSKLTLKPRFKRETYLLTFNKKNDANEVITKNFYFEEALTKAKLENVIKSGADHLEFDYFMYLNQGVSQHYDFKGTVAPNKNISEFVVSKNTTFDVIFREKKARVKIIAVETSSENNQIKPTYAYDDAIKGVEGLKLIKDEYLQKLGKLEYTFPAELIPEGFELDSPSKELNVLKEDEKYVLQFNLKRKKMTLKFLNWDNTTQFREVNAFYGKKISTIEDLPDILGSVFLGWAFKENNKRIIPGYVLDFYKELVEIIPIKGEEKGTIKTWFFTTNPKTNTFQSDVLGLDFNTLYQKYKDQMYLVEEKQIKTGLKYNYQMGQYENALLKEIMDVYQGFTFEGLSNDYIIKNNEADGGVVAGRKNDVKNIVYYLKRKEVNLHFKRLDATDFLPSVKVLKKWFGYNDLDMKDLIPSEDQLTYEKIVGYKFALTGSPVSDDNLIDTLFTKEYLFSKEFWENDKGLLFTNTKYMFIKTVKVNTVDISFFSDDTLYKKVTLKENQPTLEGAKELFYSAVDTPNGLRIPKKTGYIFMGWYLDKSFTKLANPYDEFKYNANLYAKWVSAKDFVENYIGSSILDYYSQNGNQAINGPTTRDLYLANPSLWGVDYGRVYYPNLSNLGFDIFDNTSYDGKFQDSEKDFILNTIWPFNDDKRDKIEYVFASPTYKYLYRSFNNLRNLKNIYLLELGDEGKTKLTSWEVPNGDDLGIYGERSAVFFNNTILKKIPFSRRLDLVFFKNLFKLEEIEFSSFANDKIKQSAFENNYNLTNVDFNEVEPVSDKIPKKIFKNAYSIKNITLPKYSVSPFDVEEEAFLNALSLERVMSHPDSNKFNPYNVMDSAFKNCEKLIEIGFINQVTNFGDSSMENTKSFKSINKDYGISFGRKSFFGSGIKEIVFKKTSYSYVGAFAFANSKLEKFSYTGQIAMEAFAFYDVPNLVHLGSGINNNLGEVSVSDNYEGYFRKTKLESLSIEKFGLGKGITPGFFKNFDDSDSKLKNIYFLTKEATKVGSLAKYFTKNIFPKGVKLHFSETTNSNGYLNIADRLDSNQSSPDNGVQIIGFKYAFKIIQDDGKILITSYVKILSVESNKSTFSFSKISILKGLHQFDPGYAIGSVVSNAFNRTSRLSKLELEQDNFSEVSGEYYPNAFTGSIGSGTIVDLIGLNSSYADGGVLKNTFEDIFNFETIGRNLGNTVFKLNAVARIYFPGGGSGAFSNVVCAWNYKGYMIIFNKGKLGTPDDKKSQKYTVTSTIYNTSYLSTPIPNKTFIYKDVDGYNFSFSKKGVLKKNLIPDDFEAVVYNYYFLDGNLLKSGNFIENAYLSPNAKKIPSDEYVFDQRDLGLNLGENVDDPYKWYKNAFQLGGINAPGYGGYGKILHSLVQKNGGYLQYNDNLFREKNLQMNQSSNMVKNLLRVANYNSDNKGYYLNENRYVFYELLSRFLPGYTYEENKSLSFSNGENGNIEFDYKFNSDDLYDEIKKYLKYQYIPSNIRSQYFNYTGNGGTLTLKNFAYKFDGKYYAEPVSYKKLVFDNLSKSLTLSWQFLNLKEIEFNNSTYQLRTYSEFDTSNIHRIKTSVPHCLNSNNFPNLKLVETDIKDFTGPDQKTVSYVEALNFWAQKGVTYLIKNPSIRTIQDIKNLFNNLISKSNEVRNHFNSLYPTEDDKNELYSRYILNPEKDTIIDGIRYVIKNGVATALSLVNEKYQVNIPDNILVDGVRYPVTKVASGIFKNFEHIHKVQFGDNIIDYSAQPLFKNNKYLEEVIFGKGYTKLTENEFENCDIKTLYFRNPDINLASLDSVKKNLSLTNANFKLSGKYNTYVNVDNTLVNLRTRQLILGSPNSNVPKNIKEITSYAFNKSSIEKLNLPDSVERISQFAFNGSKIKKIYLGTGIKEIRSFAFKDCKELREIWIPKGTKYVGAYAFEGCSNLTVNYEGDSIPQTWDKDWLVGVTNFNLKKANPGPIS